MNLDELAVQGQVVADRVLEEAEAAGKGHEVRAGEVSDQQSSLKGRWDIAGAFLKTQSYPNPEESRQR